MLKPTAALRLTACDLALARAWVEGLDLAAAWERYIPSTGDRRRAAPYWAGVRRALAGIARRHSRLDIAALLRRDPGRIAGTVSAVPPSLEEFSERLDDPDFYSQAELLRMWQDEYGSAADGAHVNASRAGRAIERRERLRLRLRAALRWLEPHAVEQPGGTDSITGWLEAGLSGRLRAAGIERFEDLQALIRRHGPTWYRRVPRLGPLGAERLLRWCLDGQLVDRAWLVPRTPSTPGWASVGRQEVLAPGHQIAPLERFVVPGWLDGSAGSNRAPLERCKLAAANDWEAVQAWLALRPALSHTWRAYRKEAERFVLWAVLQRGRALSSLTAEDCTAYRDFLMAPPEHWCSRRGEPRWSPWWRPFEGPLSTRSARSAITIVGALCEWLAGRRYLDSNPWQGVPALPGRPSMPTPRSLTDADWKRLMVWLDAQPGTPARERLRLLFDLAYTTGMRPSELRGARLAHLRLDPTVIGDETAAWSLMVLGKRAKWREIPLQASVVEQLRTELGRRGFTIEGTEVQGAEDVPLIAHLETGRALSAGRLATLVTRAFEACAEEVAGRDAAAAKRFRMASTHWLRHTFGTHLVSRDVGLDVVQSLMGHDSVTTTAQYVRAHQARLRRELMRVYASGS